MGLRTVASSCAHGRQASGTDFREFAKPLLISSCIATEIVCGRSLGDIYLSTQVLEEGYLIYILCTCLKGT